MQALYSMEAAGPLLGQSHVLTSDGKCTGTVTAVLASTVLAMQAFARTSGASGKGSNLELAQSQTSHSGIQPETLFVSAKMVCGVLPEAGAAVHPLSNQHIVATRAVLLESQCVTCLGYKLSWVPSFQSSLEQAQCIVRRREPTTS